jgi:hypothetical protein
VRADAAALELQQHLDFAQISSQGRLWRSPETIESLVAKPFVEGEPEELQVDGLTHGNAVVTYRLTDVRRCSLWIRGSSRWQIRFHLGTPVVSRRQCMPGRAMSENR